MRKMRKTHWESDLKWNKRRNNGIWVSTWRQGKTGGGVETARPKCKVPAVLRHWRSKEINCSRCNASKECENWCKLRTVRCMSVLRYQELSVRVCPSKINLLLPMGKGIRKECVTQKSIVSGWIQEKMISGAIQLPLCEWEDVLLVGIIQT